MIINTTTAVKCVTLKNSYPRFLCPGLAKLAIDGNVDRLPNGTMGHECKPCLKDKSYYAGPIEKQALGKVHFHIMPVNMVHDERESMQKGKDEECISCPSVKHLKSFVRNSSE